MDFNSFFEVDGLQFAEGVAIFSGELIPDVIAPVNALYFQTNGDVWRNSAEGNNWAIQGSDPTTLVFISADHIASDNSLIVCNNSYPITITLPSPDVSTSVSIKKTTNSEVVVLGIIDGKSNTILKYKNTSITLRSIITGWIIV